MTPDDTNRTAPLDPVAVRTGHSDLDCSLSVNTILARYPSTLSVFNRFGLDTCCGAVLSVADAAHAADANAELLCGALSDAVAASTCP